jgi:hypothetical protein
MDSENLTFSEKDHWNYVENLKWGEETFLAEGHDMSLAPPHN